MIRFIWAQVRGRPRRTVALLAGVLVATTGFTVLSAGAAVQQLRVTGTVDANYRAAYDILVRPKGSRTALEDEDGLVRPNYLSGLYGGITMAQLDRVRGVGHVELAAPVAVLGYTKVQLEQTVDLTDQVDRSAPRQLFRLTPSWIADRGLTVLDDAPQYVYLTRNEIIPGMPNGRFKDGSQVANGLADCATDLEVEPDGRREEVCWAPFPNASQDGTTTLERTRLTVRRVGPDGRFETPTQGEPAPPSDRLVVTVTWPVMVLVAAIDPVAEAGLVDLDKAIVSGRYLSPGDRAGVQQDPTMRGAPVGTTYRGVPVIVASTPYVDEQVDVSVERLGAGPAAAVVGRQWDDWVPRLAAVGGTPGGAPARSAGAPRFGGTDEQASLGLLYQSGPAGYRTDAAGVLHPEPVAPAAGLWRIAGGPGVAWVDQPPALALDSGFRPVARIGGTTYGRPPEIERVGLFDPDRLRGFSPLSKVPLETYQAPEAVGADATSRRLLGGEPLRPNSNPAGYLATPPLILTNLASLVDFPAVAKRADPLSAIRVRVAGVTGVDPRSRELLRLVAGNIAASTGLDVDITIGSSPEQQTVVLPSGKGGRPELRLSEGWSRKGVAVLIVQASDRKSLVLFGLILLVCALFLGNAVAAAVRDRRRELAVLACLGWPASRLALAILGEVGLVGLTAGTVAAGIAVPLSHLAGVSLSGWHALLALPVGVGISLLAGAMPAVRAARAHPRGAVHPAVLGVRRGHRRRTVLGLALANLTRLPGRTALGVVALAVGIASMTLLVAIGVAFHNEVTGSLLGDAVALRVRLVDLLAALAAVVLGVLALADILYINIRERSAELAALWASGWTDRALLRLVGYEGVAIGVLGAVAGAGVGLLGTLWIVGSWTGAILWLAAVVACAAVVVTVLVALIPALLLRRIPLSTLLAEE